jgi:hypothetical protein
MGEWEKILFNKVKNGEKLDYNELQCIERCLRMHSLYNDLLNTQIGVVPNKLKLEFADKYIPR